MSTYALTVKTVTTRKPHTCEQCSRQIAVGERALYQAGPYEGSFYAAYQCDRCTYLIGELWSQYGDQDEGLHLPEVMGDYDSEIRPELVALWKAPGAEFVRPEPTP